MVFWGDLGVSGVGPRWTFWQPEDYTFRYQIPKRHWDKCVTQWLGTKWTRTLKPFLTVLLLPTTRRHGVLRLSSPQKGRGKQRTLTNTRDHILRDNKLRTIILTRKSVVNNLGRHFKSYSIQYDVIVFVSFESPDFVVSKLNNEYDVQVVPSRPPTQVVTEVRPLVRLFSRR